MFLVWSRKKFQIEGELDLGKKKGVDREEGSKTQPAQKLMNEGVIVLVHAWEEGCLSHDIFSIDSE